MTIEKVEKLVANLYDKAQCVKHIGNLKQPLNHGLVLKKMNRFIINTALRKKIKNDYKKTFLS